MNPEVRQRLRDALAAAQLIEHATQSQTLEGYLDDEWFRSAAERQLEIIGEAFNQASRLDPDVALVVQDFRGWIGMRNILAHAYQDLKPRIIWDTIRLELPGLITALSEHLSASDQRDDAGNEDTTR